MEVIFNNTLGDAHPVEEGSDYEAVIRRKIADAVDYEESFLAGGREENQNYYYGHLPAPITRGENGEVVNRSSVVSTDVRDTILSIMPSLIRIFASSEHVVCYSARQESGEPMARQATEYANYVFWTENQGFLTLHSVLKDALTVKTGIVRVWTDMDFDIREQEYQGITHEQLQLLISEVPNVEVVYLDQGPDIINSVTLRYQVDKPQHRVEAVPPEEFRISREAKTIESAGLIGYERQVSISDLIKRGYDRDDLMDHLSRAPVYSDERNIRNPALTDGDYTTDVVDFGEFFIRVDSNDDGIEELHHICTVGSDYHIVSDVVVDDNEFAVFTPDPRPHTVIGDSIADLVKDIQKIKTNMIRANLDNLSEANNPRTVINELLVNVEDALNDEVGAVIRTRGDPATSVSYAKIPYIGADILQNVKYMDEIRASRTGITEASKGLDPAAMQSTALVGIDAIVSGAQERIELIARILCETGYKRMFKLLLREFVNNPNNKRTVKLTGGWTPINPSLFDPEMDVSVNATLGKGSDTVRLQALLSVKQDQIMIMEKYGLDNPVATPVELRNTLSDVLELANIKNVSRYFKEVTPDVMRNIATAPKEPDPATLLAQAELEKVKATVAKAIADRGVKLRQMTLDEQKFAADEDFRRDKMLIDSLVELLGMGQEAAMPEVENLNTESE